MPLDFFWGDEDFLIEEALNKIKKEELNDDINDLNYKVVDNPSFALFSELLRSNAMMFGSSVIVIKCPKYFLETKQKEKLSDKETLELIDALNNLSDRIHFVLLCPCPRGEKKKPDSRKKLYKEILKLTKPVEFQSYKNYEEYKLIPVIKRLASNLDLKIGQNEASKLIQSIGSSLRDLNNSLEKLKLFLYPDKTVTVEAIENNITNNVDIYNLIDLILKKDYTNALNLIADIISKEHYLPSMMFLQTVISNLVKLKIYHKKLSGFELSKKLNQHEFIIKKNIEKISSIPISELVRLKVNLLSLEYNLKSGNIKDPLCGYELAFLEENYE